MAYFTAAEARDEESSFTGYSDAQIDGARTLAEEAFEHAAGLAFEPRIRSEIRSGAGTQTVQVTHLRVRVLTSATDDGTALDVSKVRPFGLRGLYRPERWPSGVSNLSLTYEHGEDAPPLRVRRAVMMLAKNWLLSGPIDDRATQIPTGDGGAINLLTPGLQGSVFGIPEVDAAVAQYGYLDASL